MHRTSPRSRWGRAGLFAACLLGTSLIGGCASRGVSPILQPMRDVPAPGSMRVAGDAADSQAGWAARELLDAVAEAEQFQRDYQAAYADIRAVKQLSGWATWLGGASALGLVLTGGAGQFPVAFGIGAAGIGAAQNSMLPASTTLVYIEGARAVGCALTATAPLVRVAHDNSGFTLALNRMGDALRQANASAAIEYPAASAAYGAAQRLRGVIALGGTPLRQQMHSIKLTVDRELAKSEPDIPKILQALPGLQSGALSIAAVKPQPRAESGTPQSNPRLVQALQELEPYLTQAFEMAKLKECTPGEVVVAPAVTEAPSGANTSTPPAPPTRPTPPNDAQWVDQDDAFFAAADPGFRNRIAGILQIDIASSPDDFRRRVRTLTACLLNERVPGVQPNPRGLVHGQLRSLLTSTRLGEAVRKECGLK